MSWASIIFSKAPPPPPSSGRHRKFSDCWHDFDYWADECQNRYKDKGWWWSRWRRLWRIELLEYQTGNTKLIRIADIVADIRSEYFLNVIYRCGSYKNINIYCTTQIGRIIDNRMWPDKRFHSVQWVDGSLRQNGYNELCCTGINAFRTEENKCWWEGRVDDQLETS